MLLFIGLVLVAAGAGFSTSKVGTLITGLVVCAIGLRVLTLNGGGRV